MANTINLDKVYITDSMDEVYAKESATAVLDGDKGTARQGANANEMIVKKIATSGLRNYDRASGYKDGNVNVTNETLKCNYDRGIKINVDTLDNQETGDVAFGKLAQTLIRTQEVPEIDAFRVATYCQKAGIGTASADLASGDKVLDAINVGVSAMDDAGVYADNRYLFIVSGLYNKVKMLDTIKSREILDGLNIVKMLPTRMYSKIDLKDDEQGGYAKNEMGKNVNFLLVQKDAVVQYQKHVAPKTIAPEVNQSYDGWTFCYRNVGIAYVYDNKVAGIYAHLATK